MGLGNNIGRNVHLTLVANPITAASTVFDSAWIDCADYDGCMFTATYGAATTNMTVTVNTLDPGAGRSGSSPPSLRTTVMLRRAISSPQA